MPLASLIDSLEERFAKAGICSARADAEIIAGHVLGLKRSGLYLECGCDVLPSDEERIMGLARRRAARYPLQYIIGQCDFYSLTFEVREGVFIPRPETEVLVESVVRGLTGGGKGPGSILEIGTGTGVISVSLARELGRPPDGPGIVATDISTTAVENARANAARHGVRKLMEFVVGDGISFLRETGGGGFDVFVCNPPYVADSNIEGLEPEVRDYEPRAALSGGEDGLDFIRRTLPALPSILTRGALVALEIASDQAETVSGLLRGAGASGIEVVRDLSNRDRVIIARMA